jgi:hypothetical protein
MRSTKGRLILPAKGVLFILRDDCLQFYLYIGRFIKHGSDCKGCASLYWLPASFEDMPSQNIFRINRNRLLTNKNLF